MRHDTELAAAHHEAGHAVATVLAFRRAAWLPLPAPTLPVRYLEIVEEDGQWSGACTAKNIYSVRWPLDCIAPRFRPLMEAQVCIHLAGGISEAIFRGERCQGEVLRFAELIVA